MDRRAALMRMGVVLGHTVLLGCVPSEARLAPKPKEVVDPLRERLAFEVNELQASPLKELLKARALPYYQQRPPFSVNRSGFVFSVHDIRIGEQTQAETDVTKDQLRGSFHPAYKPSPHPYRMIEEFATNLPFMGMLTEEEKPLVPRGGLTSEGIPFANFKFPANVTVYDGSSPGIEIIKPASRFITLQNRRYIEAAERFAYIKELSTLLGYDIQIEQTYLKMRQMNWDTHTNVMDDRGQRTRVEMVNQIMLEIYSKNGRWPAVLDLAGYALGFKAIEGTELASLLSTASTPYRLAQQSLKGLNFGTTFDSAMDVARNWALKAPEARGLIYTGNLNLVP